MLYVRRQCSKLVCEFLQAMVSECPPLLHLLLRQTLPMEALVLLLDGVSYEAAGIRPHPGVVWSVCVCVFFRVLATHEGKYWLPRAAAITGDRSK